MKYFFAMLLMTWMSSTFAQEALTKVPTQSTTMHSTSGGSTSETANVTPTTEQLDILQFPTGSIVAKGSKIGEFQTWQLASASEPENMEAIFDSQSTTDKNLSELKMTERTDITRLNAAIVNSGTNYVKYNLENGPISRGDYITISSEPGVGMKAVEDGFTIGVALENSDKTEKQGLIKIRVMLGYDKFN